MKKNSKINLSLDFFKEFVRELKRDNVTAIAAQLSYYLLISIFPFIIFFLNIISSTPLAAENILRGLNNLLPYEITKIIEELIYETINTSSDTLLSLSALTGIWAASKGALAFIRVMNQAYKMKENRGYLYTRILAIFITISLFLAFILVLLSLVFGQLIGVKILALLGLEENIFHIWNYFRKILALVGMILIFTLLFKYAPATRDRDEIKLKESLPGAIFSSIGWIITSILFSYYVNNFGNFAKTYGSLGGIVVLLLWLYLSSIIIIIGGELNAYLNPKIRGQ